MKGKNFIVVSLLILVVGLAELLAKDPKMFFVNGVNNSKTQALESALVVETSSNLGFVDILHNRDVSLASDFWEAAKMSLNWDRFYTKLGTINTDNYTLNVLEDYKNNPRRQPVLIG